MISPAQASYLRKISAAAAASAAVGTALARPTKGAEATEYELIRARLGVDLRRLREVQSIDNKIALKRELLPAYADWVKGVLEAAAAGNRGVQDEILVQTMIWRIDVGDYEGAFPLIEYVLRWGLALPERFNRTAATMIAEEFADAALKALGQGEDFDLETLQRIDALTADHDMHDQVRAKLQKALGQQFARLADRAEAGADGPAGGKRGLVETALKHLREALRRNEKVGVKKDIERLEREQKKLTAGAPEAS